MSKALDLNKEQKRAFNKLVKTYKECERLGIKFVNCYGTMLAFDKEYVKDYTDRVLINEADKKHAISTYENTVVNTFKTDSGWADDEHLIVLTPKGFKEHNQD